MKTMPMILVNMISRLQRISNCLIPMKFKIHDQNWRGCHLRSMYMYVQSGGFRWRKNLLSSNALFYINFKTKYFVETWNRLEFNPGNQPQNSLLFCRRAFKRNSINFRSFLFLGNVGQKKMGLNSMNLLIHVILLGCTQVAVNYELHEHISLVLSYS